MALADLEKLVRLALDHGLIGPERRRQLMDGLPLGFVYSLPTVSRPIDQLRFDLMELERTPRLIGLDRPPLAVWLENAATMCATEGRVAPAQVFAEAADRVDGGGRAVERITGMLASGAGGSMAHIGSVSGGGVGVVHGPVTINNNTTHNYAPAPTTSADAYRPPSPSPRPPPMSAQQTSGPPGFPRDRRTLVLSMHPDAELAWRDTVPPLEPQGRTYAVATPHGAWFREFPPHSPVWRHAVENLDEALGTIHRAAEPGDCLAIFAKAPFGLGALIGARLRERLARVQSVVVFQEVAFGQPPWRPWGPTWSRPVTPDPDTQAILHQRKAPPGTEDLALVVQLSALIDEDTVAQAMTEVGAPTAPRLDLAPPDPDRRPSFDGPTIIEALHRDLRDAIEAIQSRHPKLRRLHLFYAGPLALMIRLGSDLHERRFRTTIYEYRADHRYVPAVRVGGWTAPALVGRDDTRIPGAPGDFEVFIAYATPDAEYAEKLYDALSGHRLRAFLDRRSLRVGDVWSRVVPAALSRSMATVALISPKTDSAWYQHGEFQQAIRQMRQTNGSHRILPILIEGMRPADLPYGLQPLHAIDASSDDVYQVARRIRDELRQGPSPREMARFRALFDDNG